MTSSCTPRKWSKPKTRFRMLCGSLTPAVLSDLFPDVHPLVGRQIELVARLDVERLVPGVEVPHDSVDPVLVRAVRVAQQLLPLGTFAALALPRLRISNEEALVAGVAVDHWRLAVTADVPAIGGIGRLEPAEIGKVFAERQLALDVHAGNRLVLVELGGEPVRLRLVLGGRRRGPPVLEAPLGVELAALVVIAV